MMNFENFNKDDFYIVFFPSGEVLEVGKYASKKLLDCGLIKSSKNGEYFTSYDYMIPNIKIIIDKNKLSIEKEKEIKKIEEFLLHTGVSKECFKINDNMSIDIIGSITMTMMSLHKIPYKFNKCSGDFICSFNNLVSLNNSPDYVSGKFDCSHNRLTSLKGGPKYASTYLCNNNNLVDLEGSPFHVKFFNCSSNRIKNYNSSPNLLPGGKMISQNNPVEL